MFTEACLEPSWTSTSVKPYCTYSDGIAFRFHFLHSLLLTMEQFSFEIWNYAMEWCHHKKMNEGFLN